MTLDEEKKRQGTGKKKKKRQKNPKQNCHQRANILEESGRQGERPHFQEFCVLVVKHSHG